MAHPSITEIFLTKPFYFLLSDEFLIIWVIFILKILKVHSTFVVHSVTAGKLKNILPKFLYVFDNLQRDC